MFGQTSSESSTVCINFVGSIHSFCVAFVVCILCLHCIG